MLFAALVLAAGTMTSQPADPDAVERRQLFESLRNSCRGMDRDDQWEEADACRRAWFTKHEKEVWRLNLNPHGVSVPQPSS